MARPRRAVIRAAVASNRPRQPRLSAGVSQNQRATANIGVSRGGPAKPSNAQRGVGRGGGGAGAPNPSTGLPQSSTAMPWDSQATLETAGGYRNAQDKLAGLRGNWDAEQRSIGIGAGYENNPYSQASLLQRQREIGTRGINQRPGQLYSGATMNHLGQVEHGYSEGRAHLQEDYEARRAREEREELATQHEIQQQQEEAQLAAIERAREEAPEPAPVGEAPRGGGGGGKKKPPPKFKQNDNLGGKKKR
jgi:hypothetical protein